MAAAWLCLTVGAAALWPAGQPLVPSRRPVPSSVSRRHGVTMKMPLPVGSLVALATPMKDDGSVDVPTLRELLQWHKAEGTDGVVILGTTGEASTLSETERAEVMSAAREELGGKIPIVVGTGTISTEGTIAATKQAKLFGADAALVVTPYYVKPSQAGLIQHFTAIADASELPIILYNVPGRTGVDLSVESTIVLSRHPMIGGLKDATGDNTRVGPMRAVCGDEFRLYSGEDAMAREYVLQGGDGVISVTANVAPASVAKVMAAANARDTTASEAADRPLMALHRDLFCEANPVQCTSPSPSRLTTHHLPLTTHTRPHARPSPFALRPPYSPLTTQPSPFTLHPSPFTLHPSPFTLTTHRCPCPPLRPHPHLSPLTLHLSPLTLHPSPSPSPHPQSNPHPHPHPTSTLQIPVKWALAKMGKSPSGIRSPLSPLDIEYHNRVEGALVQASLP